MSHDNEPTRTPAEFMAGEMLFGGPLDYVFNDEERQKRYRELSAMPYDKLTKLSEALSEQAKRFRAERRMTIDLAIAYNPPAPVEVPAEA